MEQALTPVSKAERALQAAKTPAESKQVEALAAAAKAWAKEQGDYENNFEASTIYIKARRNTTELSKPFAPEWGGDRKSENWDQDNSDVNLIFNFTPMQWSRRLKELEVSQDKFNSYLDDCIEKQTIPTVLGLLRFSSNYHLSEEYHEWYTPKVVIAATRKVMGIIDLDPASTAEAQTIIKAGAYYDEEDDGLTQPWHGNVWLNPPFSMPMVKDFSFKVVKEYKEGNINSAIVLTNNSTDTEWFHVLAEYPFCLTRGRLKFWGSGGTTLMARQGQVLFYLGKQIDLFASEFSKFGVVFNRYDHPES